MSTETTYPDLDETQRVRVAALEAARAVLRGVGLGSTRVEVTDLHSLATFILDGSDPWMLDEVKSEPEKGEPQTFGPSPIAHFVMDTGGEVHPNASHFGVEMHTPEEWRRRRDDAETIASLRRRLATAQEDEARMRAAMEDEHDRSQVAQAKAARDALSEVLRRFARAEIGPQGRAMLSTDRLRVVVDEMLETLREQG